ncbi:MAG: DEAD/DEAH box helicase [Gammaproteobacteria bacterium]|nr:DEAD/DEAH box helicase [Gammaproteobacteria bacterium]
MNLSDSMDVNFNELPLHQHLHKVLEFIGFSKCTPIQAESLPILLAGRDVAGQAQTGTGKTAAFLLATMHHLLQQDSDKSGKKKQLRALIISPTRELAIQIHNDAIQLNKFAGFSLGLVYGGVDYMKQREMLEQGVDILIGTPGRLIDYCKQKVYSLSHIRIMVLDEADRMFDLGFIKDIRYLMRRMPKPEKRLSMLFSATLSWRVTELAYEHMNNPKLIKINPQQVTVDKVKQVGYHVSNDEKISFLLGLLKRIDPKRTLLFVNTKRTAERVWGYLESNGYHAAMLSGDVPQRQRERLFKEFTEGRLPVLVATDVASRGLHVPDISHVINYDMPQNAEDYVHRIGRTARAGSSGDAVSLICEEFVYSLHEIEEFIGHKLPMESVTDEMFVTPKPPVRLKKKSSLRPGKKQGRRSNPGRRARR